MNGELFSISVPNIITILRFKKIKESTLSLVIRTNTRAHNTPAYTLHLQTAFNMSAATVPHLSGLFRGSMTKGDGSSSSTLNWVLSMRGSGGISVFGCGYTCHTTPPAAMSDSPNPPMVCNYQTLRGAASLAEGTVSFVSKPTRSDDQDQTQYIFEGVVTVPAGDADDDDAMLLLRSPSIHGKWQQKGGGGDLGLPENAGTFTVTQVPLSASHNSGLWLGEAIPLDAFKHDTARNPITWALSSRTQDSLEHAAAPAVFGCGFFDDSGDVPGMPVLFYTLTYDPDHDAATGARAAAAADGGSGSAAGDDGGGGGAAAPAPASAKEEEEEEEAGGGSGGATITTAAPSFIKMYEEPIPHRVQYTEVKQGRDATGQPTLSGSWTNVLEATMGVFAARMEEAVVGFQVATDSH